MSEKIIDLSKVDDGKLVGELLAYLLYTQQVNADPQDSPHDSESWRVDTESSREEWRRMAKTLTDDLLVMGVRLKIAKRRVLVETIEDLIVAPAAPAYEFEAPPAE